MADVMSTADIVRRLRDGVPCYDAPLRPCRDRSALAGCDCTIAADKIEDLQTQLRLTRAAVLWARNHIDVGHADLRPAVVERLDRLLGIGEPVTGDDIQDLLLKFLELSPAAPTAP